MSFGTFSSKYGSEPMVDLDLSIEADHPFTFSEGLQKSDTFMATESGEMPPAPTLEPEAEKGVGIQLPNIQDIPWSVVLPIGVIGVFAAGIAWYLTGGKMPDIPV